MHIMKHAFVCAVISCMFIIFVPVLSSAGDRSLIYVDCLTTCVKTNCTIDGENFKHHSLYRQEFWCWMLKWSCREECQYQCMWHTVNRFQRVGQEPPKFHGKWPFARFMGMQEPASTFASMLNLMANAHMYKKIRREFPIRQAYSEPIIAFWHGFAWICMNAWVWSTIFHMRDTPFTEFMDYACALSMVMGLFIASVVRACNNHRKLATFLLVAPLFYFVTHVGYLYEGIINYDYNMKLNIFFGALGSIIWLGISYQQRAGGRRYAWRMAAFTMLSAAALTLELFDFPPYHGWDAHALWHLCTAPLPLLFYGYVIEDLRYLQLREVEKFAFKLT